MARDDQGARPLHGSCGALANYPPASGAMSLPYDSSRDAPDAATPWPVGGGSYRSTATGTADHRASSVRPALRGPGARWDRCPPAAADRLRERGCALLARAPPSRPADVGGLSSRPRSWCATTPSPWPPRPPLHGPGPALHTQPTAGASARSSAGRDVGIGCEPPQSRLAGSYP